MNPVRIIQIDDDFINNMANERLLRKMDIQYDVTNFLDPTEALQFLEGNIDPFDLIILDINMPRLNGWEFLDKYRPYNKHIPIVMLTSSLDPNDQKRAAANDLLNGFYIKPLSKEIMIEILNKCVFTDRNSN